MKKDLELVTYTNSSYVRYRNEKGSFWKRNGQDVIAAYVSTERYSELKKKINGFPITRKFREKFLDDEDSQNYRGDNGIALYLGNGKNEPIKHSSLARKIYDSGVEIELGSENIIPSEEFQVLE